MALWEENEAPANMIISNAQHSHTLPAYVAYTDSGVLVGNEARNQRMTIPENTIYDIPSLLGARFDDAQLQLQIKNWSFKVVSKDNKAMIEVTVKGKKQQICPEAIAAALLSFMKESAEAYSGVAPTSAVISVPAAASHLYRCALRDACNIAGLPLWRLVPDLTATVVGCFLPAYPKGERNVLVLKFGRSSLSACLTAIDDGIFEAIAIIDDVRVGGAEIDACLASHFTKRFAASPYEKNLTADLTAMRRLRARCERAKITLSTAIEATVAIDVEGTALSGSITRAELEALIANIVALVPQNLDRVLRDARRPLDSIREVILFGGGSAMPCLQRAVGEYFSKCPSLSLFTRPDPACSVAALAAVAAILGGDKSKKLQDLLIIEVTPVSIGIPSGADIMSVLIPRNSAIPCRRLQVVASVQDNQTVLRFGIYAGERTQVKDNMRLLEVSVAGLMPAPRGVATAELKFEIDSNGILSFSAYPPTAKSGSLSVECRNAAYLSVTQLDALRDEELAASTCRKAANAASHARRELQAQVDSLWQLIERDEPPTPLLTYDREALTAAVTATCAWLNEAADAPNSAEVYREKQRELDERVRRVPASSFGPPID